MDQIDAILLLKTSCSGIDPYWKEYMEFWQDEEERGFYNDISVFSRYVVDRYAEGQTQDFDEIFGAYEYINENGNAAAKELAIIGFLEGILFLSSHQPFGTHAIEKWMGPAAKANYNKLRIAFDELARTQNNSAGLLSKVLKRCRGAFGKSHS